MSYKLLLKGIKAYPAKRLICDTYQTDEGCCAIGVFLPPEKFRGNTTPVDELWSNKGFRNIFKPMDVVPYELSDLQWTNDNGPFEETPEKRYERVVGWLEARVKEEREEA